MKCHIWLKVDLKSVAKREVRADFSLKFSDCFLQFTC